MAGKQARSDRREKRKLKRRREDAEQEDAVAKQPQDDVDTPPPAEAVPADPAPEEKKKKKPRWRDQRAATLVVTQLSYEADAPAVAEALAVAGRRPTVRLVTDAAATANGRKHAGLAYAVYATDADAAEAAARTYTVLGRAVGVAPLDGGHDAAGRRTDAARAQPKGPTDAQAVDSYITETGLEDVLDDGVKRALRNAGYRVACRVCRDVAKALAGAGKVENPNAYALGVLRNAAADTPACRLTGAHVDTLIDRAVAAAPGVLGRADVDTRCRSYMREFPEAEVVDALDKTATRLSRPGMTGSASMYLMGLLKHAKEGTNPSAGGREGKGKGRGRGGGKGKGRGRGKGEGKGRGRGFGEGKGKGKGRGRGGGKGEGKGRGRGGKGGRGRGGKGGGFKHPGRFFLPG